MKNEKLLIFSRTLMAGLLLLGFFGCKAKGSDSVTNQKQTMQTRHPVWSKKSNIYEVNIRQYTPEGTLQSFRKHLPRLQKMGVDILWLMPVFPISEKNRKGSLGSYYAVKNYKAVNPEFGTMDNLVQLVKDAHQRGMHVILDWVANHTGWDNAWATEHPDWYQRNSKGEFKSPFDWTDVIQLDYSNQAMRHAMISAMEYWVTNADVDGFRCDVAGMVPTDFWEEAKTELDKTKHIFMLAEDEDNVALLKKAFDMNYTWKMLHLMNDIAQGKKNASDINAYLQWNNRQFTPDMYRMYFTSNHDENSWNGTALERLGNAFKVFTVFDYTIPGMPLTYSGQEAGNNKRLRFFEKDTINWTSLPYAEFYTLLNQLKKDNRALWNGLSGGDFHLLSAENDENIFAFARNKEQNSVLTILNLSDKPQKFEINSSKNPSVKGKFTNAFTGETVDIQNHWNFELPPWGFVVLVH